MNAAPSELVKLFSSSRFQWLWPAVKEESERIEYARAVVFVLETGLLGMDRDEQCALLLHSGGVTMPSKLGADGFAALEHCLKATHEEAERAVIKAAAGPRK